MIDYDPNPQYYKVGFRNAKIANKRFLHWRLENGDGVYHFDSEQICSFSDKETALMFALMFN